MPPHCTSCGIRTVQALVIATFVIGPGGAAFSQSARSEAPPGKDGDGKPQIERDRICDGTTRDQRRRSGPRSPNPVSPDPDRPTSPLAGRRRWRQSALPIQEPSGEASRPPGRRLRHRDASRKGRDPAARSRVTYENGGAGEEGAPDRQPRRRSRRGAIATSSGISDLYSTRRPAAGHFIALSTKGDIVFP